MKPPDGDLGLTERLTAQLAGRYTVAGEVARGGMARVYRGHDVKHGRDVAIKILDPELAHTLARERFDREIAVSARLNHPNILPILDSGSVDGIPFFIAPYMEGATLAERIRTERQMDVDEALRITREVAEALQHAHDAGIVHRDIKPGNILLSSDHAVVADFGVAQAVARAAGDTLTRSGVSVGTPSYMSPEQATGERDLDARSDLYSLACVTYEMLAGTPPFEGRTVQAIVARHVAQPPPSVRIVRPAVSAAVDSALTRALAKVPADRFRTVTDFLAALEAESARPRTGLGRSVMVGAAIIAVVAVVWMATGPPPIPPEGLDPQAVVVFPLVTEGGADQTGEGVASLLGYLLDDTEPLRWIEGWHLLDPALRESQGGPDTETARRLSAEEGAAHFITGRIVGSGDSVTVVLNLHGAEDGAVRERAGETGARDEPASRLALRAMPSLLLPLLDAGQTVDPSLLSEREPAALTNFYLGESEYRRGRFDAALDHYYRALRQDTMLALAALRGAETAIWLKRLGEARATASLAARSPDRLPPSYVPLATGIDALLGGRVDDAVQALTRHLEMRPGSTAGWTALGEAYLHHFPAVRSADRRADEAFRTALRQDSAFLPAAYHVVESAVLRGERTEGADLWSRLEPAPIPPDLREHMELILSCGQDAGPEEWQDRLSASSPTALLSAGFVLSGSGATRACALDALDRVVDDAAVEASVRFFALQVLGATLLAEGRTGDAHGRTQGASDWSDDVRYLHLAWDVASGRESADGGAVADAMRAEGLGDFRPSQLWLLGTWHATHGEVEVARAAEARLAADPGNATAARLATSISARLDARAGRSDEAIRKLREMRVEAPVDLMQWRFWQALYPERLLLVRLLLDEGDASAALDLVESLSQTYPRTALSAAFASSIEDSRRAAEAARD